MDSRLWEEWNETKNPYVEALWSEVESTVDQEAINRLLAERLGELRTEVQVLKKVESEVTNLTGYTHKANHEVKDNLQALTWKVERLLVTTASEKKESDTNTVQIAKTLERQNEQLSDTLKILTEQVTRLKDQFNGAEEGDVGVYERLRTLEKRDRRLDWWRNGISVALIGLIANLIYEFIKAHHQ